MLLCSFLLYLAKSVFLIYCYTPNASSSVLDVKIKHELSFGTSHCRLLYRSIRGKLSDFEREELNHGDPILQCMKLFLCVYRMMDI